MAQTMTSPSGLNFTETFVAPDNASMYRAMDERRAALESKGHTFVSRRKTGRNAQCPCGSGFKFKKCCLDKAHVVG